jgi:hypothetical protein
LGARWQSEDLVHLGNTQQPVKEEAEAQPTDRAVIPRTGRPPRARLENKSGRDSDDATDDDGDSDTEDLDPRINELLMLAVERVGSKWELIAVLDKVLAKSKVTSLTSRCTLLISFESAGR